MELKERDTWVFVYIELLEAQLYFGLLRQSTQMIMIIIFKNTANTLSTASTVRCYFHYRYAHKVISLRLILIEN